MKENYIAYFDETGDDGNNTNSSDIFLLTSIYMSINSWQNNYDIMLELRKKLKQKYNFFLLLFQIKFANYYLCEKY